MNEILDCRGLECPQPVIKLALKAPSIKVGTTLIVYADCSTFKNDVGKWCTQNDKVLINTVQKDGYLEATIQF